MHSVTVVGSINVDLVVRAAQLPAAGETVLGRGVERVAGGKGANQAVALARLGVAVDLVSAVGTDEHGAWVLASLEEVDRTGVATMPGPTGLALVTVDDAGENSIVVVPGANALVRPPARGTTNLVVQLEVPVDVVDAAVRAATGLVVLNAAPAVPLTAELLSRVDVLVVNETEALVLAGCADLEGALHILVPQVREGVVVTLGSAGCRVVTLTQTATVPARPVPAAELADTVGAGDAFVAALTWALLGGSSLTEAARVACTAGSLAVRRRGARSSPTHTELAAALVELDD